MRERTLFICVLVLICLSLDAGHAGEYLDYISAVTTEGTEEWASTRGCQITQDGVRYVSAKMEGTADTLKVKGMRFGLTPIEERWVIKGVAQAYLDQVSVEEFGPARSGCVMNARVLMKYTLPAAARNPDTGILDVDGSRPGADIFIDGKKKGNIRQAFILSIGEHTWRTMKCEQSVQISPRETRRVYCSKK